MVSLVSDSIIFYLKNYINMVHFKSLRLTSLKLGNHIEIIYIHIPQLSVRRKDLHTRVTRSWHTLQRSDFLSVAWQ